jgi:hypothetical protein
MTVNSGNADDRYEEDAKMICQKCGVQNGQEASFCIGCGAPLAAPGTEQGAYQQPQYRQPQYQQPQYQQPQYQQPQYQRPQYQQPPYQPEYQRPKKKKKGCLISVVIVAALAVILIAAVALNGGEISFSTANVSEAAMASEIDPVSSAPLVKTDVFPQSTTTAIYAAALMKNVPDDTKLSAIWYHIPTGSSLASDEITISEDLWVNFSLANPDGFDTGEYKVEILVNGKVDETLYFKVE